MIKPGTLCLLIGDHPAAGKFCTVLWFEPHANHWRYGRLIARGAAIYAIELSDGRRVAPSGMQLGAVARQLLPIEPPADPVETHERDEITA